MTMNPVSRSMSDEAKNLIEEYLKNGGAITTCKKGETSSELGLSNNQWGQRKPKGKKND